jgi:hypothetical protein
MAVAKIKVNLTPMDKFHADRILLENKYPHQRAIRQWHVDELAEYMTVGTFTQGTQIHLCETPNGKAYLVNGNHTLRAISKSDTVQSLSVLISSVETMTDVADHYSRHDHHLSRTLADSSRAHDLVGAIGISAQQIDAANCAVKLILNRFMNTKHANRPEIRDNETRVKMLFSSYGGVAKEYFDMIAAADKRYRVQLQTAAVVGVAFLILKSKPSSAKGFFSGVIDPANLSINDPRAALHRWIVSHPLSLFPPPVRARAVALAWHRFVAGKKLNLRDFDEIDTFAPLSV